VRREDNPLIAEWGLEEQFVVGYMGNMGRFHDMETIMEVARRLEGERDVAFVIAGDGHKKKWVLDYVKRHTLTSCQVHPSIDAERYPSALACAHVGLVSLSAGQEGLSVPSKTFTLMAAGIPVVAVMPAACEIARIVEEVECGLVVAPSDVEGLAGALLRLRGDAALCERMGARARMAVEGKYSIKAAAKAYLELVRDVASHMSFHKE